MINGHNTLRIPRPLQLTFAIEATSQRLGRKPSPSSHPGKNTPASMTSMNLKQGRRWLFTFNGCRFTYPWPPKEKSWRIIAAQSFMLKRNVIIFTLTCARTDGSQMQGKEQFMKTHNEKDMQRQSDGFLHSDNRERLVLGFGR